MILSNACRRCRLFDYLCGTCHSLCSITFPLHSSIGFHPAIVRAVFDIHSRGREYLPTIRTGAITPPAFRRLAAVKFSPTVRMTEFSVRNARHEGFPTLLTDSLKRRTQILARFQPAIPLPAADALLLQSFLFRDLFRGRFRHGGIELADKLQINVHLLHPVTCGLVRGVDNDLINELVNHRRGQL